MTASWPDELYGQASAPVGRACGALLVLEKRWVHRRVETIDVLSTQSVRRSVSVDLTVPEAFRPLLRLDDAHGLVPLAVLRKRPLRHFDLRDEGGGAVPAVGRRDNGAVAHAAMLAVAELALAAQALPPPSGALSDELRTIATSSADEALDVIRRLGDAASDGDAERRAVLDDDASSFLLHDLAANYVLLAVVGDLERRRILKFAYDDALELRRERSPQRLLGWSAQIVEVELPAAGRTASYHAEIVVPEELRIEAALVLDEDTDEIYTLDVEADRAAVYAGGVRLRARARLLFGVRPERAGFPVQAAAVSVVTAALLVGGALLADLEPARAGPTISILLAGSAVFAGSVARIGEHRLVQSLFLWPRLLLIVSALGALAGGAALAFGVSGAEARLVWGVGAALVTLCAILLVVTAVRARPITPNVSSPSG